MHNKQSYYFYLIILTFAFTACKKEIDIISTADKKLVNTIANSESFDDIFKLDKKIQLTGGGYYLSTINALKIGKNGDLIILDSKPESDVVIFNSEGIFKSTLAKHGSGPGEYRYPQHLTMNARGELLVYDIFARKINIYDSAYNYMRSISPKTSFGTVCADRKDNLFFYEAYSFVFKKSKKLNTVIKADYNGDTIKSFAPINTELFKIDLSVQSAGLGFDKQNFIYEMNPLFYEIRKFDENGNLVKKFGESVIKFKEYDFKGQKMERAKIMYGPFVFDSKIIMAEAEGSLDFYDDNGTPIKKGIPFDKSIIAVIDTYLYIVEKGDGNNNPSILKYSFR